MQFEYFILLNNFPIEYLRDLRCPFLQFLLEFNHFRVRDRASHVFEVGVVPELLDVSKFRDQFFVSRNWLGWRVVLHGYFLLWIIR